MTSYAQVVLMPDSGILLAIASLPIIAIVLDWTVFVPINNLAHIAFPNRKDLTYGERSRSNPLGYYRTAGVLIAGLGLSAGFLVKSHAVLVASLVALVAFHVLLYWTKSVA